MILYSKRSNCPLVGISYSFGTPANFNNWKISTPVGQFHPGADKSYTIVIQIGVLAGLVTPKSEVPVWVWGCCKILSHLRQLGKTTAQGLSMKVFVFLNIKTLPFLDQRSERGERQGKLFNLEFTCVRWRRVKESLN